jgi:hypothetical protein
MKPMNEDRAEKTGDRVQLVEHIRKGVEESLKGNKQDESRKRDSQVECVRGERVGGRMVLGFVNQGRTQAIHWTGAAN